jgi:hypothetical protein
MYEADCRGNTEENRCGNALQANSVAGRIVAAAPDDTLTDEDDADGRLGQQCEKCQGKFL